MKKTTFASWALLAALTVGTAMPAVSFAEEAAENNPELAKQLNSTGTVEVTEGQSGDKTPLDPEDPSTEVPKDPEVVDNNPNTGAMSIEKTTSLNFGKIATSANKVVQYAVPVIFDIPVIPGELDGETKKENRGNFVQWTDVRAGANYGYTITAELSSQFTGKGGTKLNAAQINYSNGEVRTTDADQPQLDQMNTAFSLMEAEEGKAGENAVTVVTADKTKQQGKGRFIMAFGKSDADKDKDTTGKSVQLEIPSKTASSMAADTYTAKVTWKIVAAP
ncbi:WxL domain-containing protein [Enterococcus rivorum]|uniref:WxL domain-containing protein n=1 Tax=Enterococcus rivorum TaxID=762845 RepID=A0A1E5KY48_9ENTE|nr:WxL domain-containing protein [Enterococcus rivorum]MBP2099968.1 putative low-complexity protein [Enterococcus rivorum]OEH82821.1 hypothetical protein BCR26_11375 [Enterococcus rivorum]